jgi:hypothetical protein
MQTFMPTHAMCIAARKNLAAGAFVCGTQEGRTVDTTDREVQE